MMRPWIDEPPAASRILDARMNPLSTNEVWSPTEKGAHERKRETTLNARQIYRRDDETKESCGQVVCPSLQHVGVGVAIAIGVVVVVVAVVV